MPSFKETKPPKPFEVDVYLGLNESVGETEIKKGEAVYMRNYKITNNFKPQKRSGHQTLIDFGNSEEAYLIWDGLLGVKNILLVANNGNIYEYDKDIVTTTILIADLITEGTVVLLGTMTNAPTRGFYFRNVDDTSKVYLQNGVEFKEYDGSVFQDVVGYIPTIAINAPPSGGGTLFEEANLLSGFKTQTFVGDGSSTLYQLAEDMIDADLVTSLVDGVVKVENVDFTMNRTLGQPTWTIAPISESEVSFTWNKAVPDNVALVVKNRFAMDYGFKSDTNIFMWGNPEFKDRRMRSGTLRADYYPVNNFTLVGAGQFGITDIQQANQQQVIFTEGQTFWSTGDFSEITDKFEYAVYDLNENVGHEAYGQGQLVDNKPVTLFRNQIKTWAATDIENERNEKTISDNLKLSLAELDLSQAITFDYQKNNEYWVNIGDLVYIWNYFNDTFYIYDNINGNSFREIDGVPVYGAVGTVEKFDDTKGHDNGFGYEYRLELGFTDFDAANLLKNSNKLWIKIEPQSNTGVNVIWQTDNDALPEEEAETAEYRLIDYSQIDYAHWTYDTSYNPAPFRFKIRAKKYNVIKLIFFGNDPDRTLTLLSLMLQAETMGEVK